MQFGFIGLGEVGTIFALGMLKNGAIIKGYDILAIDPNTRGRFAKCQDAGIILTDSLEELIDGCDYVLSLTSSKVAVSVAESCLPFLKENQVYIDMNSAVPTKKRRIAEMLAHCKVIDGITVSSPSQFGMRTEVVFSGPESEQAVKDFNSYGMNTRSIGNEIGQAGALKVLRSVFTKGLESVLIESLMAAEYYHVFDEVYATIISFVANEDVKTSFDFMVRTNVVHALRRGDEVQGVAEMLGEAGIDNRMSMESAQKLYWLSGLGTKSYFNGEFAKSPKEAIDAMLELSLKK